MPVDTHAEYDRHAQLDRLESASADRDVLVSLIVPPDESIGAARQPVETDYAEATKLDEQSLAAPLVDALESARQELADYEAVPKNGLAIYTGVVDGDLLTVVFDELPLAVDELRYEQHNEFTLEPLTAITGDESTYGLLVVERGGAAFGRYEGETVEVIDSFDSNVPGKSSAGGQSAERFERDRERQKREFFDEVAERAARTFLDDDAVDGILLGGTTGTIDRFRDEADLDHRFDDHVTGEFSVEYATEQGLRQLAEKGQEAIDEQDHEAARETLSEFFDRVQNDGEPIAYGMDEVDDALEYDAVETVLLSTALDGTEIQSIGDRAVEQGGETVVVPDDFADGSRFVDAFDGVGALLRFPIE
ncbi:homolog to peptide chain release factor aRF-1 [Natrialba magadii ATCC 43099]|uniref:Homolog to peptide chain release factor aRF-1 n=1 Tax=Natrialba magadii (strain ATCC 43099 / DSM 3394 / CCM 3739 / CIP 104546 / IAM 13178 / JCM 8861 / NBRC 102185 / NCIMB 2190 / MS3) TaxID=547559 RepID=D3T029_NATMM|nr:Vms1/Ankzf1 family peptidyl-tRNA hydrolase [Natrialba magadii]ADD04387.1 homolog to peptide chain release factor aRF-1 [Natrialba magadii ATCC 43099]ELY25784.1 peptide chain release factor 1 [Natrialba magadii ATCC 43099]